LHYACDGATDAASDDPAQEAVVSLLVAAGCNPNAWDKSGVAPLHRAVRTRRLAAVRALLAGGAGAALPNKNGSRPLDLARQTTGRGSSGTPAARDTQQAIIAMLEAAPAKP
jgi:ankyrin repeat protein